MHVEISKKHREQLLLALERPSLAWNEVVWTALVAHLLTAPSNSTDLLRQLSGEDAPNTPVWLEAQPLSARRGVRSRTEGNSRIDLALGHIQRRDGTEGGIEYAPAGDSWVCFVEAKVLSDCACSVTHDPYRNQLARVIEALLCFQNARRFPCRTRFVLLTPRAFRDNRRSSRLYGYKFDEYERNRTALLRDLNDCHLSVRDVGGWTYPALAARERTLTIAWVAYEDLFDGIPELRHLDLARAAANRQLEPSVRDWICTTLRTSLSSWGQVPRSPRAQ